MNDDQVEVTSYEHSVPDQIIERFRDASVWLDDTSIEPDPERFAPQLREGRMEWIETQAHVVEIVIPVDLGALGNDLVLHVPYETILRIAVYVQDGRKRARLHATEAGQ